MKSFRFKNGFPSSRFWPSLRGGLAARPKFTTGFSIIELLGSVFLLTVISTIVYYSLSGFKNREFLDATSRQISSLLEEARSLTISGQGGTVYGVYFQSDEAVRFTGSVYATSSANKVYTFDSGVYISNISLQGGGTSVVFNKLTGTTNNYGSLNINLYASTSTKRTVIINSTGIIDTQ